MTQIVTKYNASSINNEVGIALEDFVYGGNVKLSLPALTPFYNSHEIETKNKYINLSNIMNKDKLDINDKACSCNYISVYAPPELYRYKSLCPKKLDYKGKKGERFLVSFLSNDINYPVIIRRL